MCKSCLFLDQRLRSRPLPKLSTFRARFLMPLPRTTTRTQEEAEVQVDEQAPHCVHGVIWQSVEVEHDLSHAKMPLDP